MFRDADVEDVFTVLHHIFVPVLTSLGLARGGTHWSSANLSDGPESPSFAEIPGRRRKRFPFFEDNVSAASTVGWRLRQRYVLKVEWRRRSASGCKV
jgi:hypothetical protein